MIILGTQFDRSKNGILKYHATTFDFCTIIVDSIYVFSFNSGLAVTCSTEICVVQYFTFHFAAPFLFLSMSCEYYIAHPSALYFASNNINNNQSFSSSVQWLNNASRFSVRSNVRLLIASSLPPLTSTATVALFLKHSPINHRQKLPPKTHDRLQMVQAFLAGCSDLPLRP